MASAMIGNLAVSLTMNTAAFQRGATIAEKRAETMRGKFAAVSGSLKGIGAAIGTGVIADGLYRIAANAFEMASSLTEVAEQVGVSVEALQELRFAAEQTGIGSDKMDASIKRLNKSLGELQLGSPAAVKAFAAIGLSADDLRGKAPEQALRLIADQLNKLPDASQRVALGQQIMGKAFSDLLPLINGGSAALDQHAEASRRNGQISAEDAARLDELADSWDELKTRVGVTTANLIADGSRLHESWRGFVRDMGLENSLFDQSVAAMAGSVLGSVANMVSGIRQWITGTLTAIWDGAIAKIEAVKKKFYDLWNAVTKNSYVPDMVGDIAYEMGPRLEDVMVRPALAAVQTVSDAFMGLARSFKGGGFLDILGSIINVGMTLGSVGAFGKGIAGRVNSPRIPGGQGSRMPPIEIVPSPYFDARVDGRVISATPSIIQGSSSAAQAQMRYRATRRVA